MESNPIRNGLRKHPYGCRIELGGLARFSSTTWMRVLTVRYTASWAKFERAFKVDMDCLVQTQNVQPAPCRSLKYMSLMTWAKGKPGNARPLTNLAVMGLVEEFGLTT